MEILQSNSCVSRALKAVFVALILSMASSPSDAHTPTEFGIADTPLNRHVLSECEPIISKWIQQNSGSPEWIHNAIADHLQNGFWITRAEEVATGSDPNISEDFVCYARAVLSFRQLSEGVAPSVGATTSAPRRESPIIQASPPALPAVPWVKPRPAPKAPAAPPDPKIVAGLAALDEVLGSPGGVLVKNTKRFDEDVGEIALHCLKIFNSGVLTRNLQLGNFCPYEVEATWCVMGVDCKPTFSNMETLAPVGSPGSGHDIESTAGKGRGRTVQYAGCKGRNTVDIYREDPFTFTCRPVAQ
jgi:hypothetical protein